MPTQRPTHLVEDMDQPDVGVDDLRATLKFIRWVNGAMGATRAVGRQLDRFARGANWSGHEIIVADIATGSGDIPEAVCRWARKRNLRVRVLGFDIHEGTLAFAQRWTTTGEPIQYVRADAFALPLADQSVDVALCGLFLHHLTEPQALLVLGEMVRVSRGGVMVNDLLRRRWAMWSIRALTLFSRKSVAHDSVVSVKKGWLPEEAGAWPAAIGAPWLKYSPRAFSHFTLSGMRPSER